MPQAINLGLVDTQATPVTHTFVPAGPVEGNWYQFEDRSAPNQIGYSRLLIRVRRPKAPLPGDVSSRERLNRIDIKLFVPTLESPPSGSTYVPPPAISHTLAFEGTFVVPERSVEIERTTILKYIYTLFGANFMTDVMKRAEQVW